MLLAAVLVIATAAVVGATVLADRSIRDLADLSLRTTAADIALVAERSAVLPAPALDDLARVFADRVVAYALLARESDGALLFHTNPARRGGKLSDAPPPSAAGGGEPAQDSARRTTLGTGRPVFEFTRRLEAEDGSRRLLRLALYTGGADQVLARARRLWASVAVVLGLLWSSGLLLWRMAARMQRLEARVRRQETLSLIGQMTATLAHEIRNAVGGIRGHAQWIGEKTPAGDPLRAGYDAIVRGTSRVEDLVGELLLYSREERYEASTLRADDVLASAAAAAAGWPGRVISLPAPGLEARADAEKLARALTNAVRNAVEAMGDDGELTLSAARAGGAVAFTVEDTGAGVAAEALGRIFDPFYTTKAGGTGLGLAYARKVAEGMGGSATLGNRKDRAGAVFTLAVPRA